MGPFKEAKYMDTTYILPKIESLFYMVVLRKFLIKISFCRKGEMKNDQNANIRT
ncbi:hypothetical protein IKC_06221 [Bacillus cereus VD184]|uniref:Uncharacterized protein n=1 Tax=Bacillus cereus VD184 TaxID=1053242 RepID=A0A9W5R0C8_BACCE|nr:hypothetical protein IKC_06221 [Bacillus cereus VD184]